MGDPACLPKDSKAGEGMFRFQFWPSQCLSLCPQTSGCLTFPPLGWGVPSMHFVAAATFRGAHMGHQTFCHMLNVHCIKRQMLRTLQCRRAQSHFVDGETEAQKGLVPGPSSHRARLLSPRPPCFQLQGCHCFWMDAPMVAL